MQTVPRMVHTPGKKMGLWDWLTHRTVGEEHNSLSWGGGDLGHPWRWEAAPPQWCLAGAMTQALDTAWGRSDNADEGSGIHWFKPVWICPAEG